jgi:DNA-directed RNA polymerase specialized sigma24 family protein
MIQMALRSLTTEEQFMLYMKDAQECTIDELCEITSVRKGTIKSKLSRARRKMAKRLEELGYE